MKFLRTSVVVIALSLISIGLGYAHFGVARATDNESQMPAACAKCGDGQCQRSCGENERSCPRDCGGVPQTSVR